MTMTSWDDPSVMWKLHMKRAFEEMLEGKIGSCIDSVHTNKTPLRATQAYIDLFKGCFMDETEPLRNAIFPSDADQMVIVKDITIRSMCAHHFLPIVGHATFAYIPNGSIVGLSKISRFIEILAKRPQVQEHLTQQIVDTFQDVVAPAGCAVMIRAYHFCMMLRGAEEHQAYTQTTALKGAMQVIAKDEFLQAAQDTCIWGK